MRTKILLIVAVVLCLSGWTAHSQKPRSPKATWEYAVIYDPTSAQQHDEGVNKINGLGAQGWELVGVNSGPDGVKLYFKRAK